MHHGRPAERLVYRDCDEADIDAVLSLWSHAEVVPRPTDSADALRIRLRHDRDLFPLALDGDRVVGCLVGGWDGWRGNLYRLAVDPAYRRRGIAERLVEIVEERLKERGAARITSLVFRDEEPSVRFWSAVGYAWDETVDRYAKNLRP